METNEKQILSSVRVKQTHTKEELRKFLHEKGCEILKEKSWTSYQFNEEAERKCRCNKGWLTLIDSNKKKRFYESSEIFDGGVYAGRRKIMAGGMFNTEHIEAQDEIDTLAIELVSVNWSGEMI